MAQSANALKRQITDYLRERYGAMVFDDNSGRRGNVVYGAYFFPSNVFDLMPIDEMLKFLKDAGDKTPLDTVRNLHLKQTKGRSDLSCFASEFGMAAFELKTPGDTLSPIQALYIEICRRLGMIAGVVRDVGDIEVLIAERVAI